ncbi:transporter substrate-binding domain-containing protein [Enterovibrio sp. ZSDZ35]|uniref:Transporter substrate-binding domain-containing protein n=1 Tax=Enterovibrio qingdaonensis TaxID=2899818 RepID=A0ABT5QHD6_9GAMM|nr:transporter substrate-binding domain-containing protein [Enterovibrio sp. ZSDZ35]MDD1780059.1 transporter substrate-binding domain-containing protein [Enterovibrio sp. ZSDZ35]
MAQTVPQREITVISELWVDATEKDGSGLYFEIMRRVFEPLGYSVKTQTTTYSRSVKLVQSKKMDIFLGSYIDEQERVLYPKWHFDAEQVAAVYKPSVINSWQGEASLKGKTVAWIKGYDYDEYLETELNKREVKSRRQGLSLLASDRIDALLDAHDEILEELDEDNLESKNLAISIVKDLRLYPAFSDSPRGNELRRIYDKQFEKLLRTGEIKRLFDEYEWERFPFTP